MVTGELTDKKKRKSVSLTEDDELVPCEPVLVRLAARELRAQVREAQRAANLGPNFLKFANMIVPSLKLICQVPHIKFVCFNLLFIWH